MGIRASPTCAMVLGERDGARGWLIGRQHEGLACMFTMMNTMRLGVGMHSLGVAERALQLARAHAHDRHQGRTAAGPNRPIIEHADVRRMLLQMKALVQAARGLVYTTAAIIDVGNEKRASLLTPIVKAWVSDLAVEVASLGVQVHGGTGYVDDAEISQIYRDARIGPIFEGTNYIQSQDLLGRKIIRDGGTELGGLLDDIEKAASRLPADGKLAPLRSEMSGNCSRLRTAVAALIEKSQSDPELIGSVGHHFLQWLGTVTGGWQWCLYAAADSQEAIDTAAFYAAHVLPRTRMHEAIVSGGSAALRDVPPSSI